MTATASRKPKPSLIRAGRQSRQLAEAGETNGHSHTPTKPIVRDAESEAAEQAFNGNGVSAHTAQAAEQYAANFGKGKRGKKKPTPAEQFIHDTICPNGPHLSYEEAERRRQEAVAAELYPDVDEVDGEMTGEDWQAPDANDPDGIGDDVEFADDNGDPEDLRKPAEFGQDVAEARAVKKTTHAGIVIDGKEYLETVPIDRIRPSKVNPRKDFDQEYIAGLAESIKANGVLQKPLVRTSPCVLEMHNGYPMLEIVAGECRWRAAKLAGLTELTIIRREMTDNQAFEARGIENLKRKDLNPIERAQWAKGLLELVDVDGKKVWTQESLAKAHGFSQPWIANHLRLLKLPKYFLDLVRSGVMPVAQAQLVLPYVDHPSMMKGLEGKVKDDLKRGGEFPSLTQWKREIYHLICRKGSRLEGSSWSQAADAWVDWKVELTDALREELQVVSTSGDPEYGEDAELFALNLKAAAKATKAAMETAAEVAIAKAKKKVGKGSKADATREPTAAEKREKSREKAEQFKRRLQAWLANWLQFLIYREIASWESEDQHVIGKAVPAVAEANRIKRLRLLLYFAASDEPFGRQYINNKSHYGHRDLDLERILNLSSQGRDEWKDLLKVPDKNLDLATGKILQAWFWDAAADSAPNNVPAAKLKDLVEFLGIDLRKAWLEDKAGPLTREYFDLHSKEQLVALGAEWNCYLEENKPKGTLVQMLIGSTLSSLPKELAPPAKAKSKAKPAKIAKGAKKR